MANMWVLIASPGASLLAGILCLAVLILKNRTREESLKISRSDVGSAVLLAASFYTMLIVVVGDFFAISKVSETIRDGFGDGRAAWLILGLALDTGARLAVLFGIVRE
jgi:hypothetical protein